MPRGAAAARRAQRRGRAGGCRTSGRHRRTDQGVERSVLGRARRVRQPLDGSGRHRLGDPRGRATRRASWRRPARGEGVSRSGASTAAACSCGRPSRACRTAPRSTSRRRWSSPGDAEPVPGRRDHLPRRRRGAGCRLLRIEGDLPSALTLADAEAEPEQLVALIGYPAYDSRSDPGDQASTSATCTRSSGSRPSWSCRGSEAGR